MTASEEYVWAKAVSPTEATAAHVIDSWAEGPLAPSWFLFLAGGVLWDLEFMLQYISRTAYGCNEDEKQTEHWASVFLSFYAALSFYKLPLSFSSAPCVWFTLDICLEKQGVTLLCLNGAIKKKKKKR